MHKEVHVYKRVNDVQQKKKYFFIEEYIQRIR